MMGRHSIDAPKAMDKVIPGINHRLRHSLGAIVAAAMVTGALWMPSMVAAQGKPPAWASQGPVLGQVSAAFEVPLTVVGTKLHVMIEIGGQPRRFVLDTGSPSMIRAALAQALDLPVIGQSQGVDAHGVVVRSDIVRASIRIGGVPMDQLALFSADFGTSAASHLFIGDGVLGSDVLPLGAWQMDVKSRRLRFDTDISRLPHVRDASCVRLHDFGYPHAPILDVVFASDARSKAMLDTGSPAYFAISPPDLAGAKAAGGVGRVIEGHGSAGASLGGQAPDSDQLMAELTSLSVGGLPLGPVGAVRRERSPSLIGAAMLRHFVVTLDSRAGRACFKRLDQVPLAESSFGFTLAFLDGLRVALVWEGSAAAQAGLRPGTLLVAINGQPAQATTEGIARAIAALEAEQIHLEWDGGSASLRRQASMLAPPSHARCPDAGC